MKYAGICVFLVFVMTAGLSLVAAADPETVMLAMPNEEAACRYLLATCERVTFTEKMGGPGWPGTDVIARHRQALEDLYKAAAVLRGKYGAVPCLSQCPHLNAK